MHACTGYRKALFVWSLATWDCPHFPPRQLQTILKHLHELRVLGVVKDWQVRYQKISFCIVYQIKVPSYVKYMELFHSTNGMFHLLTEEE